MVEFLFRMDLQLLSDAHVFRALEHLGIDHVSDDCLVFAGQVFVQQRRQLLAGSYRDYMNIQLPPVKKWF